MQNSRFNLFCILCGSILLSSCQNPPEEFRSRFLALGTLVEVQITGAPTQQAQKASTAVREKLQAFTTRWRPFVTDTPLHDSDTRDAELAQINAALAAGESIAISPQAQQIITQAARYSALSGGRFNPAIFKLIQLWGFYNDGDAHGPPPDERAIKKLLAKNPSMQNLVIQDGILSSSNPAVQLDFGAYAKGVAVDMAIDILRDHGIENAIVNAGGDLQAIGRYQHGGTARPWRIGIRHPRQHDQVLASIELKSGEVVFTSGDYERYYIYKNQRYHHILDPATGYPARGVRSVTVIHHNPALADAASTALFVAGVAHWQKVARAMGLRYVMLIDGKGTAHLTPAMQKRVVFEVTPVPDIVISPAPGEKPPCAKPLGAKP